METRSPIRRQIPTTRIIVFAIVLIELYRQYHLLRYCVKFLKDKVDDSRPSNIRNALLSYDHDQTRKPFSVPDNGSIGNKIRRSQATNSTTTISNAGGNALLGSSSSSTIGSKHYNKTNEIGVNRKWAYAFLVSGCSTEKPGYRGFLYNAVVAATRLKEMGSTADFVAMVQMSESTDSVALPSEEEQMLSDNGIKIRYLPKMRSKDHECFYALVQEKFRVLELTEYSRVLFMDSDMMPLCNLDYMFELSDPPPTSSSSMASKGGSNTSNIQLKENVIIAWRNEAANAGFFMLEPKKDDWQELQREIRRKEERALTLPWPHWDEVEGWGHIIKPPDYWVGMNSKDKKTAWDWHAVFADQGLLYYWTKYVKKNVSIVIGKDIEQWSSTGDGGDIVHIENIVSGDPLKPHSCFRKGNLSPPYRDFHHFTGRTKPWEQDLRVNVSKGEYTRYDGILKISDSQAEMINLWRIGLLKAQQHTPHYNFTLFHPETDLEPPMGRYSTYNEMLHHIESKKDSNWTHYNERSQTLLNNHNEE